MALEYMGRGWCLRWASYSSSESLAAQRGPWGCSRQKRILGAQGPQLNSAQWRHISDDPIIATIPKSPVCGDYREAGPKAPALRRRLLGMALFTLA